MYKRYYDGYGENELLNKEIALNSVIDRSSNMVIDEEDDKSTDDLSSLEISSKSIGQGRVFSSLYIDDLLLLGVLLILLSQDCDDKLMLIIIGFVFVSEFLG